jgi:DNA-binding CsgD family transcriptional regulator
VIAAADAYHALGEDRPHRAVLNAVDAANALRNEVTAGRLDGDAANAVLAAAGHRVRRRPALPAGLTRREAEILVLMARGLSNKEMAERLSVSVRTVRSHVEHVYAKIGFRPAVPQPYSPCGTVSSIPASTSDRNIGQTADAAVMPGPIQLLHGPHVGWDL